MSAYRWRWRRVGRIVVLAGAFFAGLMVWPGALAQPNSEKPKPTAVEMLREEAKALTPLAKDKDAATAELELAIQAVARGDTYLSPAISRRVIEDYVGRTSNQRSLGEQLTPRQREILQLIAEGRTTKEIARTLHISVKTVETHRTQLMERLDIHDVAGLTRYAMRIGLVQTDG